MDMLTLHLTFYFEVSRFVYEITPWLSEPNIRANFQFSTGWERVRLSDIKSREESEIYVPIILLNHNEETLYELRCSAHFMNKESASSFADQVARTSFPFLEVRFGIKEVATLGMEDFN